MAKIRLNNVRLSFPSLFEKAKFEGKETKYEATLLLDKEAHAEVIERLEGAIEKLIKTDLKGAKVSASKRCLKDGDESDYDGYEGCMSLKAANSKRPTVIDRSKQPLTEDDNVIYSGCYVSAIIDFWAQNNAYGKRINANLLGVQFSKDGQPFGAGGVSASTDDFDDIDEEYEAEF